MRRLEKTARVRRWPSTRQIKVAMVSPFLALHSIDPLRLRVSPFRHDWCQFMLTAPSHGSAHALQMLQRVIDQHVLDDEVGRNRLRAEEEHGRPL